MSFIQDRFLLWSAALVVCFPLLVVILTEVIDRLARRRHPLAGLVRQLRNVVLPLLAILLLLRFILGYGEAGVVSRIVATLFWLATIVVSFRFLRYYLSPSAGQTGWRESAPPLLLQLPRFLVALGIAYYILSGVWKINVGGMITALGIGSLVIALALQDTLSNLFSGLLLTLSRPFEVSDWIEAEGIEGRVLEVTWRASLLRTRDGDLVVIPNGAMAKSSLKNYSRPTRRHRIRQVLDFHRDSPPTRVHAALKEAALNTPGVLADAAPRVRTKSYDDVAIQYEVLFWISDYGQVRNIESDFMTRTYYVARRHGLRWPTPEHHLRHYDGLSVDAATVVTAEKLAANFKTVPSLSVLSEEAISSMAHASKMLVYGQGEPIVRKGEQEHGIYVLTNGRVALCTVGEDGEEREVTQLSAGDFFGETGLFSRAISTINVTALTDVELLLIPHRAMTEAINRHPRFAQEMNVLIEERKKLLSGANTVDETLVVGHPVNGLVV
jgi:small-conductance mechanosensitive channel